MQAGEKKAVEERGQSGCDQRHNVAVISSEQSWLPIQDNPPPKDEKMTACLPMIGPEKAPEELIALQSTPAMRARTKELATPPSDDFDRAVLRILSDFDRMEAALDRILAEPHGCVFCDSGKLRNPAKGHEENCGFGMASALPLPPKDR